MVDVAADRGWLSTALNTMKLTQMVMQGRWQTDSTLLNIHPEMKEMQEDFSINVLFRSWPLNQSVSGSKLNRVFKN